MTFNYVVFFHIVFFQIEPTLQIIIHTQGYQKPEDTRFRWRKKIKSKKFLNNQFTKSPRQKFEF